MANKEKGRPNVMVIMTDDQGAWALGCAGNQEIRTPHLDRLAARGIRFENFFCVSPVCSPARASFLTGRIPSQHGVHDWIRKGNISDPEGEYRGVDRPIEYLEGMLGYSDVLKQNGYTCGLSGKWHLGAQETPQKGFDYWYAFAFGGGDYYGAPMVDDGVLSKKPDYLTDVITDGALKLEEWFRDYVDPSIDGSVEPVMGKGQLDWAGKKAGDRPRYNAEFSFYHEAGDEFVS